MAWKLFFFPRFMSSAAAVGNCNFHHQPGWLFVLVAAAKYGLNSVEKAPIMYSIKAAILDSLHGRNAPNNESADCKNLAHFRGKIDRGA